MDWKRLVTWLVVGCLLAWLVADTHISCSGKLGSFKVTLAASAAIRTVGTTALTETTGMPVRKENVDG